MTTSVPPNFIGYALSGGEWIANTCATGSTWSSSGSYGACCVTNGICPFFTLCLGQNQLINTHGSTATITDTGYECATQLVYETYPDISPVTHILALGGYNSYQVQYPTYTPLYRSLIPSTSSASIGITSTTDETPTSTSWVTVSPTNNPTQSANIPPSTSKAWIAGAVIGPIAAVAIIAGLSFWIRILQRRVSSENLVSNLERGHISLIEDPLSGTEYGPYPSRVVSEVLGSTVFQDGRHIHSLNSVPLELSS